MTLQDAPSLDDYANGKLAQDSPSGGRRATGVLIGLIGLILVLGGVRFIQSGGLQSLSRTGVISGYAVGEANLPLRADIIVFGTDIRATADDAGYFEVDGVPTGERSIIVAYGDIGTDVSVDVMPGEVTSLGTVTVPTMMEIDY